MKIAKGSKGEMVVQGVSLERPRWQRTKQQLFGGTVIESRKRIPYLFYFYRSRAEHTRRKKHSPKKHTNKPTQSNQRLSQTCIHWKLLTSPFFPFPFFP
ncbi:hypothetical protein HBI56_104180 [Parastagonospora nodorum]|uniref:Uncharacterized protein n=1 Tax=Phaeosphaeria nodorum (strain SN15 / ATCC MYA-4574 / FGSC 10173) TaxID=321614 RepID=A0A7U2I5L2_PHANO|nr:hypothetical protein HBH56_134730 [Parastagonospora nodorum]QRD02645.1 hypothetical protein JI435_418330 [Parastagonospora nodorum SN15]KAH3927163.1 hypothetical protein HBH54_158560 [Parastagonospora nodorum]KAH3949409.1 hypothetical protein HBH53_089790 [Parastagonospora nodorum]KAH3958924.1 hypothetical protein HBH51_204940 [Parastagonospora nodorum]